MCRTQLDVMHSCVTMQHTVTYWNTLQHTATHCSILQHTAPHWHIHVWHLAYGVTHSYATWLICDMTHMWHDSYVTWLICEMTHMWHDSYVTWLICDMTHMWHDWLTCDMTHSCVTWLICDVTYSYVSLDTLSDAFMCVTWRRIVRHIRMCHLTHSSVIGFMHVCDVTHACVWRDSCICVTWLIHVCDVTHSCVWHDSFMCVTWLTLICTCMWRDTLIRHPNTNKWYLSVRGTWYGVATISMLPKNKGLFCKRALQDRLYSAKETYVFKEPTNHSHPISWYVTSHIIYVPHDTTHPYVTWRILQDMTRPYVTWRVHLCTWHDSLKCRMPCLCVTWHLHKRPGLYIHTCVWQLDNLRRIFCMFDIWSYGIMSNMKKLCHNFIGMTWLLHMGWLRSVGSIKL